MHRVWISPQWISAVAALLLLSFFLPQRVSAAAPASEAEIKAVLLFHLTQFVTWPTSSVKSATFDIGVVGPDPFGGALDTVVAGEKANGKPIRIVRSSRARDLPDCPLVFVSAQARESLSRIFTDLGNRPTLTVGDTEEFIEQGGMIRFRRTPEKKIRLQIQLNRARQSGLNISAQLLRVSDVIPGGAR
jgi:hypothetical protein